MFNIPIIVTSYKIHKSPKLVDLTIKCLESSIKQSEQSEVFLFDDCSYLPKSIIEYANDNKIKVVKSNHDNLAKLLNDICNTIGAEYACILNNDIILAPDAISNIKINIKDHPEQQFIWATESCTPPHKFAAFSAFTMSKTFYETIGQFDERFTFFYVDSDFEARSYKKFGYVPFHQIPSFKVHHETSATKQATMDDKTRYVEYLHAAGIFKEKWGEIMYSPETKQAFFERIRKKYLETTQP